MKFVCSLFSGRQKEEKTLIISVAEPEIRGINLERLIAAPMPTADVYHDGHSRCGDPVYKDAPRLYDKVSYADLHVPRPLPCWQVNQNKRLTIIVGHTTTRATLLLPPDASPPPSMSHVASTCRPTSQTFIKPPSSAFLLTLSSLSSSFSRLRQQD